tara:strand:- start:2632 stop:2790 length:159 start_codon:yes stop_codon:yes gene_type:complete
MTFRGTITKIYSLLQKKRLKKCGKRFSLGYPSTIYSFDSIEIGNNVHIREHA